MNALMTVPVFAIGIALVAGYMALRQVFPPKAKLYRRK